MKTLLPFIIIIGFGLITFFMTREKSETELISDVYYYSLQSHDSLTLSYQEDSMFYDIDKYLNGDVIYGGTFYSKTNLPYIEMFINQKNKTSIKKVYYQNGNLKFETNHIRVGEYILKEWDTLGSLVTDTIKKSY